MATVPQRLCRHGRSVLDRKTDYAAFVFGHNQPILQPYRLFCLSDVCGGFFILRREKRRRAS